MESTQALVAVDPAKRSTASFQVQGDPWPQIALWAKKHGFLPREPQTPGLKMFQKGSGLWTAPMRAQFALEGDRVHVQAWIHVPLFSRIMALFLLPQEMNIQSGGFRAVVPRKIARKAVNELLEQMGATPIP
ncbi:MAG: hypothetical protein ACTHU0_02025 [Kofleriaceae bacterium]